MREVLYRGKRTDNGEWIEGRNIFVATSNSKLRYFIMPSRSECSLIEDGTCGGVICGVWREVIPETVGQCVGICDKNRRKVFEGDIVDLTDTWFGGNGVVEYKDGCWVSSNRKWKIALTTANPDGRPTIEVIGNIYDNPELLEA